MADSDEDVPPLEDMTELLQQVDALRDHGAFNPSKTPTAVVEKSQATIDSHTKPSNPQEIKSASGDKKNAKKENSTFGGMNKGFLFGGPKSASKKCHSQSKDLPIIKPKQHDARGNDLKLPEVQEKMDAAQAMMQNKDEWLTEDLLKKVASNPSLMKGMANPQFMQAITEFQTDPHGAMQTYGDNPEVKQFLMDFAGIMGSHFTNIGDDQDKKNPAQNSPKVVSRTTEGADITVSSSSNPRQPTAKDEEQMQNILQIPEIQDILQDPKVQLLIETLRTDPDKAQRVLSMRDADLQYKIKRLVDVGLLQLQR